MDAFKLDLANASGGAMLIVAWVLLVVTFVVHVCFATGVAVAIRRMKESGRTPWFVSIEIWVFATLIGGVLVAALFWLMHYSVLSGRDGHWKEMAAEPEGPDQRR